MCMSVLLICLCTCVAWSWWTVAALWVLGIKPCPLQEQVLLLIEPSFQPSSLKPWLTISAGLAVNPQILLSLSPQWIYTLLLSSFYMTCQRSKVLKHFSTLPNPRFWEVTFQNLYYAG